MSHPKPPYWTLTNQRTGEVIPLTGADMTIGRQADNDLVLADAHASRRHAVISWQEGTYVVRDVGSSQGTYLDGQRITGPEPLQPGTVLQMGESTFVVGASPAGSAGRQKLVAQPAPGAAPLQTPDTRSRSRGGITAGIILGAVVVVGLIVAVALLLSGSRNAQPAIAPSSPVTAQPLAAVETATEPAATFTLPPAATEPAATFTLPPATTEPTATFTPPAATEPAATSTSLPTASESPTSRPTDRPTATVTQTSPPPTAPPPSPTPKPKPTQTQSVPAPTLLAPQEQEAQSLRGQVTFRWAYPKPLEADQAFQVLIWKEGRSHDGAAQIWTGTEQTIDLDVVLPQRGGTGEYFWTVVVRHKSTEKLLSPEPGPWRLVYVGSEAPPNKCAGVCEQCTSWAVWYELPCAECGCTEPEADSGFKPFMAAGSPGYQVVARSAPRPDSRDVQPGDSLQDQGRNLVERLNLAITSKILTGSTWTDGEPHLPSSLFRWLGVFFPGNGA